MTTINEENRKTLRKSMKVVCDFQETDTAPTSLVPVGIASEYEGLAGLNSFLDTVVLMDLAGDGFLNDGSAVPIQPETDTYRYGYISEDVAQPDGTFLTPFGVQVSAAEYWDMVTVEIADEHGNIESRQIDPHWVSGTATIYIDSWTPGERAYIVGVHLGKYWRWDNSTLLDVSLDLRGVNTQIGGDLEVSSIEIQAYEPNDYTEVIGRIPKGSPIRYLAGYSGDMSEIRLFYLSEDVSWDNNVLTVRGQDASMLLDDVSVPIEANYSSQNIGVRIKNRIEKALEDIDYTTVGTYPSLPTSSAQRYILQEATNRALISQYMNMYCDSDYIKPIYVDAGIPTLYWTDIDRTWDIYADEITDLDILIEHNINEIMAVIEEYYERYNSEIETVEAVAGRTYFIDTDNPIEGIQNLTISPEPTSKSLVDGNTVKFMAAATTTYTISGYQVMVDLKNSNNPYVIQNNEKGIAYTFDNPMPSTDADVGSVTKLCLPTLLSRSNIVYEFTYRGNPHIQPRDILNVEIATWVTSQVVLDGLYPETDLYPATDLYPYATYKEARHMEKEWVMMTVDSITIEHSEGGTTSKIRARRGAV